MSLETKNLMGSIVTRCMSIGNTENINNKNLNNLNIITTTATTIEKVAPDVD